MLHSPLKTVCSCRLLPFSIPGREQSGANPPQTRINPGFFKTFRTLPQQHLFNELHAKESSKKVRAVKKLQAERGERLGGRPPYGYRKRSNDTKEIVPDEDTAPIVQRIFELCASGKGPNQIARILTDEKVLNPSNYYYQKYGTSHRHLDTTRPYSWSGSTVTGILDNKVYLGHMPGL